MSLSSPLFLRCTRTYIRSYPPIIGRRTLLRHVFVSAEILSLIPKELGANVRIDLAGVGMRAKRANSPWGKGQADNMPRRKYRKSPVFCSAFPSLCQSAEPLRRQRAQTPCPRRLNQAEDEDWCVPLAECGSACGGGGAHTNRPR